MKIKLFRFSIYCFLLIAKAMNAQVADTIYFQKYATNQRFINVQIEDKNYRFLFDSGAGSTFISEELASTIKFKKTGVLNTYNKEGKRQIFRKGKSLMLKIGKTFLLQPQVLISNELNAPNSTLPKLDGIVSLKTFDNQIISIDLENNLLLIESNQSFSEKKSKMLPVESTFTNGIEGSELNVFLNVSVKEKPLLIKFDTGNNDRVLISKETAKDLNLANDSILQSSTSIKTGDLPFMINYAVAENLTTVSKDLIYDGVFNYSFLSGYTFSIDLMKKKIFLLPF